jgi:hypothetical protein
MVPSQNLLRHETIFDPTNIWSICPQNLEGNMFLLVRAFFRSLFFSCWHLASGNWHLFSGANLVIFRMLFGFLCRGEIYLARKQVLKESECEVHFSARAAQLKFALSKISNLTPFSCAFRVLWQGMRNF